MIIATKDTAINFAHVRLVSTHEDGIDFVMQENSNGWSLPTIKCKSQEAANAALNRILERYSSHEQVVSIEDLQA